MTSVEALQLLELTPPFTKAELKTAYRQAQMVWHPDRFMGNDELHSKALARSYLINEAFSEISRALEAGYVFKATAPRQAATYRKVASQEPPKSAADFNRRGVGYQSKGRTNKAIADFTEAIRLDPQVAVYYRNRGVAYANKRGLPNAIADFTEAIRLDPHIDLDPTTAHSYRARAAVYKLKGENDNAISDFTEAIRLDPEVAESYFQRGISYKNKGEYSKAIVDFNEARRLDPIYKKRCFRTDFRKHGKLCESRREYDQAIADYSEVIQSFREGSYDRWRELVYDYFCRARVYRLKGDFDNAIADYSEAIRLYPTTVLKSFGGGWQPVAGYYKSRAQTHYEKGDWTAAISDLTEAIRRDPKGRWSIRQDDVRFDGPHPSEEGWIHKHALATLAELCAKSGDFDKATQFQKLFLELLDLTEEEAAEGRRYLALYEERNMG